LSRAGPQASRTAAISSKTSRYRPARKAPRLITMSISSAPASTASAASPWRMSSGAWGSCSAGYQFFIADLLQRTDLEAAEGSADEGSRTTPRTSALAEFTHPKGDALFLTAVRKSCSRTRNLAAACEPVARNG
jgi:hypothetical protein